jgi:hypothetical protein
MENDPRYLWLEKRITSCLSPKREALVNLVENEDNKYLGLIWQEVIFVLS